MSEAAVKRRRAIIGATLGAVLTLVGIHHVSVLIGAKAKLLAGAGWTLLGSTLGGGQGPFSRGYRAGAAVAGTVSLLQSASQASLESSRPLFSAGLNEYGRAAANQIRQNGENISRSIRAAPDGFFFLK